MYSVVHVACCINRRWQFANLDFKSLLNLFKNFLILVRLNKCDGETLCAKPTSAPNSVQVTVAFAGHVEVEHDVNLFDVDTTTEDFCCHQNAVLKLLETFVDFYSATSFISKLHLPFFLGNSSMDSLTWNKVFVKNLGQLSSICYRLDENYDLVKVKRIY